MKKKILNFLIIFVMVLTPFISFAENDKENDTIVYVKAVRINDTDKTDDTDATKFYWEALQNGYFVLQFKYTNSSNEQIDTGKFVTYRSKNTNKNDFHKEFYIGWPVLDVNSIHYEIKGINDDDRVMVEEQTSKGLKGQITFNLKLYEIPNTKILVKYVDPYGNDLQDGLLKTSLGKIHFDLKNGVDLSIPTSSCNFNLKTINQKNDIFTQDEIDNITDNFEAINLNKKEKLSVTIKGKDFDGSIKEGTSGNLSIIDASDNNKKKDYSYVIATKDEKDENKKDHVITLTYKPNVIIPPKNKDNTDFVAVPEGYVRCIFNADGMYKKDWKKESEKATFQYGEFDDSSKVYAIDIKRGTKLSDDEVKQAFLNLIKSDKDEENKDRILPQPVKEDIDDKKWVLDDEKWFLDFCIGSREGNVITYEKDKSLTQITGKKITVEQIPEKQITENEKQPKINFYARYSVNGAVVPVGEKVGIYKELLIVLIIALAIISFIILKKFKKKKI